MITVEPGNGENFSLKEDKAGYRCHAYFRLNVLSRPFKH